MKILKIKYFILLENYIKYLEISNICNGPAISKKVKISRLSSSTIINHRSEFIVNKPERMSDGSNEYEDILYRHTRERRNSIKSKLS